MPARSAIQRWLLLTAAVVLAHLALMGLVSDTLTPLNQTARAESTFVTRTVTEPLPLQPMAPTPVEASKAKPQAKTRVAAAQPKHQVDTSAVVSDTRSTDISPAEAVVPDPQVAAIEPEPPASAPEAKPTPDIAQAPAAKPLHVDPERLSSSKRLTYTLMTSKFPFSLNAELLWRNLGDHYSARLRYSAFGQSRMQTSQGHITSTGLAPDRFADKYRSELATHFNRAQGTISFSANTPDAPLLAGAQDRLSVLLQLGALVASDPAHFESGTTLSLQTAGPRNAIVWLFTVMPAEALELPGGTLQTVKLERQPREPYEQKIEVWLAPQLDYLPARIRVTDANGESADQQWRSTELATETD
ncbi:DUF3108 domain-containing protein [Rhodoferax sp. U11-2br]|uniref:DUF3108 domain-containing protein n=1 Tax=Rhodoferax sp. U11-2br TaxID=2838878 RepID=UPI001BE76A7F|nr:DUF3108 domain-containing protein [Rhodoferax sp. U11-2br]MBT3067733.1 DUF3108 domain-containing protein [Rhodoferax sp. U11-2br]